VPLTGGASALGGLHHDVIVNRLLAFDGDLDPDIQVDRRSLSPDLGYSSSPALAAWTRDCWGLLIAFSGSLRVILVHS
jgi:hypothetical protein